MQIGPLFTGAGPVNRSMGGASVAAPIDASGALFWNPATTSGLPSSSMDFGVELLYPQTHVSSSLPANAFGPGVPGGAVSGSNRGDDGIFALPTMALVYRPTDSDFTYGLGVFTLGGFGVNYPSSATNPILTPQPPNGLGLGSVYSELQLLQLVPTVSAQLTDRLSIGGGPTLTMANLRADPLFVTAPNANGSYPAGTHGRLSWGGGFQVGTYYVLDGGWQLGASFKSPQWLEGFHFQTVDARGLPRGSSYTFDLPLIASVGVGYTGFKDWTLAADLRYLDYGSTQGFRQSGFAPDGTVRGLGWRNVVRPVARGAIQGVRRPGGPCRLQLQPEPDRRRPVRLQRGVADHPRAYGLRRPRLRGVGRPVARRWPTCTASRTPSPARSPRRSARCRAARSATPPRSTPWSSARPCGSAAVTIEPLGRRHFPCPSRPPCRHSAIVLSPARR